MYNLLEEPLLSAGMTGGETVHLSLPELLAEMKSERVTDLRGAQAWQETMAHPFLVQVAAMTEMRYGECTSAEAWAEGLEKLGEGARAWELVGDDPREPAFLQPPMPDEGESEEEALDRFKINTGTQTGSGAEGVPRLSGLREEDLREVKFRTPDEMGVIYQSTSHVWKKERMKAAKPEHWFYALIEDQTFNGYAGRGNYGIVRMNSGYGNRPVMGLCPLPDTAGRWFARDLKVCRRAYGEGEMPPYVKGKRGGIPLLWTIPWDEEVEVEDCDPLFVEVARRNRLVETEEGIRGLFRVSNGYRVEKSSAEIKRGVTGDPWTPTTGKRAKKMRQYTPELDRAVKAQKILFGEDIDPSVCLKPMDEETGSMALKLFGLIRGQGKTEGVFHTRYTIGQAGVEMMKSNPDLLRDRAEAIEEILGEKRTEIGRVFYRVFGDREAASAQQDEFQQAFGDRADEIVFDALFQPSEIKDVGKGGGSDPLSSDPLSEDELSSDPLSSDPLDAFEKELSRIQAEMLTTKAMDYVSDGRTKHLREKSLLREEAEQILRRDVWGEVEEDDLEEVEIPPAEDLAEEEGGEEQGVGAPQEAGAPQEEAARREANLPQEATAPQGEESRQEEGRVGAQRGASWAVFRGSRAGGPIRRRVVRRAPGPLRLLLDPIGEGAINRMSMILREETEVVHSRVRRGKSQEIFDLMNRLFVYDLPKEEESEWGRGSDSSTGSPVPAGPAESPSGKGMTSGEGMHSGERAPSANGGLGERTAHAPLGQGGNELVGEEEEITDTENDPQQVIWRERWQRFLPIAAEAIEQHRPGYSLGYALAQAGVSEGTFAAFAEMDTLSEKAGALREFVRRLEVSGQVANLEQVRLLLFSAEAGEIVRDVLGSSPEMRPEIEKARATEQAVIEGVAQPFFVTRERMKRE